MSELKFKIRKIQKSDNKTVENIIRQCLVEFGGDHDGTAWTDPYLGSFFEVYRADKSEYWVAETSDGKVVGGVGIGRLCGGDEDTCELQKMYCLPEARGTGAADLLINTALDFAKAYYKSVYLETLENMVAAQKFYEKHGFVRLSKPMANTGHFSCDVCYFKELK